MEDQGRVTLREHFQNIFDSKSEERYLLSLVNAVVYFILSLLTLILLQAHERVVVVVAYLLGVANELSLSVSVMAVQETARSHEVEAKAGVYLLTNWNCFRVDEGPLGDLLLGSLVAFVFLVHKRFIKVETLELGKE